MTSPWIVRLLRLVGAAGLALPALGKAVGAWPTEPLESVTTAGIGLCEALLAIGMLTDRLARPAALMTVMLCFTIIGIATFGPAEPCACFGGLWSPSRAERVLYSSALGFVCTVLLSLRRPANAA